MRRGAVGEMVAWAYDNDGNEVEGGTNERVTSVRLKTLETSTTLGVVGGEAKVAAIRAALKGRLLQALITNERTARALLNG